MNYIGTYQYTKIDETRSKSLDTVIRFLFNSLIVRKIDISCEVYKILFFTSSY